MKIEWNLPNVHYKCRFGIKDLKNLRHQGKVIYKNVETYIFVKFPKTNQTTRYHNGLSLSSRHAIVISLGLLKKGRTTVKPSRCSVNTYSPNWKMYLRSKEHLRIVTRFIHKVKHFYSILQSP